MMHRLLRAQDLDLADRTTRRAATSRVDRLNQHPQFAVQWVNDRRPGPERRHPERLEALLAKLPMDWCAARVRGPVRPARLTRYARGR